MGKLGGLLAITTAALVLSGCGVVEQDAAPVSDLTEISEEVGYVESVRPSLKVMHGATDETLNSMAKSICALYASGKSDREIRSLIQEASALVEIEGDGAAVALAAVTHVCPEALTR